MEIAGRPRPQPRARHVNGVTVAVVDPGVRAWQAAVKRAALEAAGGCGGANGGRVPDAIGVDLEFWFGTKDRNRWGKVHTMRPDRDNLDKLVLDELVRVGFLGGDDCRVCAGEVTKWWCPAENEGCIVTVWDATGLRRQEWGIGQRKSELPPDWLFQSQ